MDLGTSLSSRTAPPTPHTPPAGRTRPPGWRDPRLWVGLALVAGSVLLGARVVAAADDTVPVWAARADLGAGAPLRADDLVRTRVRLDSAADLGRYLPADEPLPSGAGVLRPVGAGELVPRAALGTVTGTVEVPIAVEPEQVPDSVQQGAVVDVYLLGAGGTGGAGGSGGAGGGAPVLSGVTVVDARTSEESFAVSGRRRLVLAVPEADAARFFRALGAVTSPQVTVVRRG
ncbi:hypothetical protein K8Z61_11235 [Nocardioides sp. TRM66260-LWL]|uniref:hypothetical protein n=1 Tax=Nocardioides sp. TRM66260-LWL TaxID=2874478 RepID=UPI001CC4600C|nr:hypothetical protein [Nocardioides sp. TRM66260-LWL]MBZ5735072.1 hypothetical protein [Nocardioides sp. TRM66260-LWL]